MKKGVSIGLVFMLVFCLCACESVEPAQTIAGESHIAVTKSSEVAVTNSGSEATMPSNEPTAPTDSTQNTLPTDEMVWIPTKGGTKYHRTATCSGMDGPRQVTKTEAGRLGFDACKKCYK